jgi:PKD repeat protein
VYNRISRRKRGVIPGLVLAMTLLSTSVAFAQGSIFGSVTNSDASVPANGEISFFGYLDNTDEEIRIETSVGAGYDSGNWFDDFQNYLTEAPGNPYAYHFFNVANTEGFVLSKLIPNNSFQQEDIVLALVSWPDAPTGLSGRAIAASSVVISWTSAPGLTYHVYRRLATSSGSFFRRDDPTGSLANPGVADSFFVDTSTDGTSTYQYLIVAEDASGNLSRHSGILTVNSAVIEAPLVTSIDPNSGYTIGGTPITIAGSGFDIAGATVTIGGSAVTGVTLVSPVEITGVTPPGVAGPADVVVTNTASGLSSAPLVGGFTYIQNSPPVLTPIGPQAVTEGANLHLTITATDADGDSLVYTAQDVPTNASFADNYDGTAVFDFNPDFLQAGVYNVTFIVSDGIFADTEVVAITVNDAGNQAPVLAAIGPQNVTEGNNLTFGTSATDPDLDSLIMTAEGLPPNATYTDNYDGTGTFSFDPDYTQAGVINVTFIASDGALADSEVVAITVNDAGNQAPVLAAIGPQVVTEGGNLNFNTSASDPDLDSLIMTAEGLPPNATYTDNYDGTGTFDFNPDFTQAGSYSVTFIVSDGVLADTEVVAVTVNDAGNQAPVLAAIGAQAVTEGGNLNFSTSATDPDLDSLIMTAEGLPANATYTDNYDGTGTFDFNPDFTEAGVYNVTFIASDGVLADTEVVAITVNDAGNQAPVLAAIGPQVVTEGGNLNFNTSATDPDLDSLIMTAEGLPPNATYTDNYDGTGTFTFDPDYTQAGVLNVTFIVSDGFLADTEVVAITVNDAGNQPPVLAAIGPQVVTEGSNLNFNTSATDPDLDSLIMTAEGLPANATYADNYDGTGTFDFNPDFLQAGSYNVTFIVSDGVLADTEVVAITVNDAGNQAPVLAAIGAQVVTEGANLNVPVSATDADGDSLILSAENLPPNATFTDNYDGSGVFDFNPDFTQAGAYSVTFIVSDGVLADTEIVAITVNDAGNQAPVLAGIGPQSVTEGSNLTFGTSATDADLDSLIMTAENLPPNATYTDNYDGTGTFSFDPDYTQAGVINVTFIVSDGALADTEVVAITVNDAGNQAPVLAAIGPQVVTEGGSLNLIVSATDADADSLILSAEGLPLNANFTDNFDGTGIFNFNPDYNQAGDYSVTFIVSDGVLADSEVVDIAVNEAGNQAPVVAAIGLQTVLEGDTLTFLVSASDIDGDSLTMSALNLPTNATFSDNGDNTGSFYFTPSFSQSGSYDVTFIASDGVLADSEVVTIEVTNFVNGAPEYDVVGPQTVAEGDTLTLLLHCIDDVDIPTLYVSTSMDNYTFVDSGNGYAVFEYLPDYYDAGVDTATFVATDNNNPPLSSMMMVQITTTDSNQPPIIQTIPPVSVSAGDTIKIRVVATDSTDGDGGPLYLYATIKPSTSTFADSGAGIGKFQWAPTLADTGDHQLRILCLDDEAPAMSDYETTTITVLAVNQPPVLDHIGQQAVVEGDSLEFVVTASDPDGTIPALLAQNLPRRSTFVDNGDGTGQFLFVPDYQQAGLATVKFIATDGSQQDYENVLIQIIDNPQRPILTVPTDTLEVTEGDSIGFLISATDADSTIPILSVDSLTFPATAVFVDSGNGIGEFAFRPLYTQAGLWDLFFMATDETDLTDTAKVVLRVLDAGNQDPVFLSPDEGAVIEGQELKRLLFTVTTTDADSVPPVLSSSTLPFTATFTDNGDYTGTFDWQVENLQAGTYPITFYANDGEDPSIVLELHVTLEIADYNYPPDPILFDPITICFPGDLCTQDVNEGDTLRFRFISSDQDGVPPILSVNSYAITPDTTFDTIVFVPPYDVDTIVTADTTYSDPPPHMIATDLDNDTAEFVFGPDYTQSGTFNVMFRAVDASDNAISAVRGFTFHVINVPVAAILEPIGDQTLTEGDTLDLTIHGYDPDGGPVTIYAQGLPPGASFTIITPNTAYNRLFYVPDYTAAGVYNCLFYVRENNYPNAADSEYVTITVNDAGPQAPIIASLPAAATVAIGEPLALWIQAYDPDNGPPTLSVEGTPEVPWNAVFVDSANGHGSFVFDADPSQADSSYEVRFIASDGALADTATVQLSVIAFIRGDCDGNTLVNISDIVYLIAYIFGGGPAPNPYEAGDADSNGTVNISDAAFLVAYIFGGGPPPGP